MKRYQVMIAVMAAGVLTLAACSSSGGSSGGTSSGSTAATGSTGGGSTTTTSSLPKETVGLLYELKAAEISIRGGNNVRAATDALGWKLVEIDPAGDPQKAVTGMTSMVTQKVSAILSASWESSVLRQPLLAAKAANIPTINVWGGIAPSTEFTASLAPNETQFGKVAATEFLRLLSPGDKVAMLNSAQFTFGKDRDDQFMALAKAKNIDIVANHQTDYTNPQADTTKAVDDILAANPNLDGIWSDSSLQVPEIAQELQKKGLCGKVKVVGFYGDLKNLAAVRDGCVNIIADVPLQAQSWAVIDALAAYYANKTPIPTSLPTTYPFNLNQIQVITKANVPSDPNKYVDISYNYQNYFKSRWAKGQYGAPTG
jgi:ABC-type sugar transport system substrate-binding protein